MEAIHLYMVGHAMGVREAVVGCGFAAGEKVEADLGASFWVTVD